METLASRSTKTVRKRFLRFCSCLHICGKEIFWHQRTSQKQNVKFSLYDLCFDIHRGKILKSILVWAQSFQSKAPSTLAFVFITHCHNYPNPVYVRSMYLQNPTHFLHGVFKLWHSEHTPLCSCNSFSKWILNSLTQMLIKLIITNRGTKTNPATKS